MTSQHVGITGASGFVGAALARRLCDAGHQVVALTRRPVPGIDWRHYDLQGPVDPRTLAGLDDVVHCAWDLKVTSWDDINTVNVAGTARLLEAATAADVRCHFISSMSAFPGSQQLYGRAKLSCEEAVTGRGGNAIRLGLTYGGDAGGMIAALSRLARLPLIPIFGGASHQFLVHIDDAATAVQRLIETPSIHGQVAGLAYPEGIRFSDLIRALSRAAGGRGPVLVPIPWRPVYAAMRLAEGAGVSLPLRADSVLGLVRPAPSVFNGALWDELGVSLRAPTDPAG